MKSGGGIRHLQACGTALKKKKIASAFHRQKKTTEDKKIGDRAGDEYV